MTHASDLIPGAGFAPLAPTSTIGILGGGQLGRMLALAAARLGFDTCILTPEEDAPASRVAASSLVAAYDDPVALAEFAARCQVATVEFENVPARVVDRLLAAGVRMAPGPLALATAQATLDNARINGQDDVINLQPGNYSTPSGFMYYGTNENYSLTLQSPNGGATLDGESSTRILAVKTSGAYITMVNGSLTMDNNIFTRNWTGMGSGGGGLYLKTFDNSTLVLIRNSILWGNLSDIGIGADMYFEDNSAPITITCCCYTNIGWQT